MGAWLARLEFPGWFHLVYFGLVLPFSALRGSRRLLAAAQGPPDRLRHFRQTSLSLVMLATLSILVAQIERIPLFPRQWPPLLAVGAGLAMYALTVAAMRPRWRRAVERRSRVVHLFMPDNARERGWWISVSVLAGICEELTWRGVQPALVVLLGGPVWLAALLSAVSFGAAHLIQGWQSAAIIVLFALGFQTLAWLGGSLYVAMAVHIAYDITAGISYGRLGRELGYSLPAQPAQPQPASDA